MVTTRRAGLTQRSKRERKNWEPIVEAAGVMIHE